MKCKQCGYDRKKSDNGYPSSECPICGLRYNNDTEKKISQPKGKKELSTKKIAIGIGVGILGIVFVASSSFDKFWAHLISPFDSKPKISFTDLVKNPEKIQKYKKELCGWLKREELRNPSIYTTAARESVCKDIK